MANLSEKPVHPGEVLAEVYMKSSLSPISVDDLSEVMDVSAIVLTDLLAGRRPMTQLLAVKLAVRFRTTVGYWLGLQELYDQQIRAAHFLRIVPHVARPL